MNSKAFLYRHSHWLHVYSYITRAVELMSYLQTLRIVNPVDQYS